MLQRKFRLPSFVRFTHAHAITTPFFSIKFCKNGLPISRFGFIVSKKVDKRAVVRNRVKRQVRHAVEQMLLEIMQGYDILFILRRSCIQQDTSVISQEVKKTLVRNGLVISQNKV